MDIISIASILEDMENDAQGIKLLFGKKMHSEKSEEKIFVYVKKYCKISYTMLNHKGELPIWAKTVLSEIKRVIAKKQGYGTVEVSRDDSLKMVYQLWKTDVSPRKKEELEKLISILEYRRQSLLKEEFKKSLERFDDEINDVLY